MSYKVKQVTVCLLLLFLPALTQEDRSQESAAASFDRIIIVYPLEGCGGLMSESVSSDLSGLELQSPRRARDVALNELERRINELRTQRLSSNGVDLRYLSPDERKSSSLVSQSGTDTPIRLTTRYLNAVQMEIANVPAFMTDTELVDMSESLPCVQMVSRDAIKRIQDPITDLQFLPTESELHRSVQRSLHPSDIPSDNGATEDAANDKPRHLQGSVQQSRPGDSDSVAAEGNSVTPNDQLFPDQWHLQQSEDWGIGSQLQWGEWRGSPGMVIAIIDSGCDLNHPDLAPKRWVNTGEICGDGVDNDRNGYVDDCNGWDWVDNDNSPLPEGSGHGTAAAGIIAAATNNGVGVAGICWDCKIMCLRFIQGVEGRVSNQVAAIDYAAKMGAKISNNSYGGYGYSRLEYEGISRARAYGHLFVSSAGNNNYNTDLPQYDHTPSIYDIDNILAVGASTRQGKKASFSNYGRTSVDVYAPGSRIVTVENGGGYAVVSGTSFAAPMGVGAAALVWSRFPNLSNTEVIRVLSTSCKKSQELNGLGVCGGVIDIGSAMRVAGELAGYKAGGVKTQQVVTTTTTPATATTPSAGQYGGWINAFLTGLTRQFSYPTAAAPERESAVPEERHRKNLLTEIIDSSNGEERERRSRNNDNASQQPLANTAMAESVVLDEAMRGRKIDGGSRLPSRNHGGGRENARVEETVEERRMPTGFMDPVGLAGKAANTVERLITWPINQLYSAPSTIKKFITGWT